MQRCAGQIQSLSAVMSVSSLKSSCGTLHVQDGGRGYKITGILQVTPSEAHQGNVDQYDAGNTSTYN